MARFYVGQRVRVVGPSDAKNLGRECRVRAVGQWGRDMGRDFWDGIEVDIPHSIWPSGFHVFEPENLEPILPEGHAPSKYTFHELMDSLSGVQA